MNTPVMKAKFRERPYMADRVIFLEDLNGPKSITNDAETIVMDVVFRHGWYAKRILYRDTIGHVAELVHEEGVFIGFAPLDEAMWKFVKDNVPRWGADADNQLPHRKTLPTDLEFFS